MHRRTFLSAAGAALATGIPVPGRAARTDAVVNDPRALIMDAMGELRMVYEPSLIREMLASGMDSITITLCDPKPVGAEALELAVDSLLAHDRYLEENPQFFLKATSVADVDEARRSGRMAVFYLYQNSIQFGEDLDRVNLFRKLGVTSAQVTYNHRNLAGVGCMDEQNGGLTPFGFELIDRMNRVGMLVDLSHAGEETMMDTIAHSRVPVIISHTCCSAVYEHARNTSDRVLRTLADHGGVVGICQMRPFLTEKKQDNLHAYFDHIDHAVQVCGADHVCIGSDRDHRRVELTPEYLAELRGEEGANVRNNELPYFIDELNGPARMEVVWDGLVERGHGSSDVEKIMGGSVYRLYEEVIG